MQVFHAVKLWAMPVLLCTLSWLSNAQSAQNPQYFEALRLIQLDRQEEALRILKSLHRESPQNLEVIRKIGELEFRLERWSNAKDWYRKLYEADSNDADALFHLGVIYRETGKYKAFLLRDRDWKIAADYFERLSLQDPSFKNLYFEYAVLERYRERYDHALELFEQQLNLSPTPKAVVAYFRCAESFIYNRSSEALRKWAAEKKSAAAQFFIAESYRIDKNYAPADSIYARLASDSVIVMPKVPLFIAWAKSRFEQNDPRRAQALYEKALDCVTDEFEAALFFDHIKYILSDDELKEYESLKNADEKRLFFKKLWVARNPMPASEVNYRLLEHLRRYLIAERQHYYDGFRLPFNNPDRLNELVFPRVFDLNDKFNDKGLIYIRHGEPDDRAFDIEAGMPLNESWLYQERGQLRKRMIFHFVQGETQTGNNWRLSPSLPTPLLESRISWDPIYNRIITGSAVEALAYQREMVRLSREDVSVGLNTDQHSWEKSIKTIIFPFYLATFRADSGLTRLELYYSVDDKELMIEKSNLLNDSLTVNFGVYDNDLNRLFSVDKKISFREIKAASDKTGYWPDQMVFIGPPDRYQLAIDVRTPQDRAIGGYKFKINLSDYRGNKPSMSGIILASSIQPAAERDRFVKNHLQVVPNPPKLFNRKSPLGVYFELYNLPIQEGRSLSFEVEYVLKLLEERADNILQTIGNIFRNRQPSTSMRIERSATNSTSIEYLLLDLKKYVPGIYELQVNVSVPTVEDSLTRKINFELK
ncbi:MAG: hypothetical protein ONB12_10780 [candidate division KSB1 bacterium]|nr:hypothetical protein [candidate division KSB1 bacterium]